MKVYVTQGHEKGIGLEVFFKSCILMTRNDLSYLKLLAFQDTVTETLKSLKLPYKINPHSVSFAGIEINCEWLNTINVSQSFTSLELAMKLSEGAGVLYTLPTSKDQFPGFAGHTEFFRDFYHRPDLGMFFSAPNLQVLLLSDHIPVNKISNMMTEEIIYKRLKVSLESLRKWHWPTEKIMISGFNPHAGEKGLIGHEDLRVSHVIERINEELKINILGPLPGDTMLFEQESSEDLLVYLFHDQGLGVFKSLQGFIGSNITLGLPFPRFSPDHGTSFGLFGNNQADYRGCEFSLKQAVRMLKKGLYEKDSSHKS
jgi:4-hydroxy-L-threonine phosphate dehydrogenase PdxA